MTADFDLPATTHVGRVALRVESLDRVLPFYRTLGLQVSRDGARARLTAGDETRLVLVEDAAAPDRRSDEAGLFHLAVRVPDRVALANVLLRARRGGVSLSGASDHLVSEALYFRDPEGNGVEVYRDRPRDDWPWTDDGVAMETLPLDLDDLRTAGDGGETLPPATDVGHVHLEVTDLARAEAFYVGLGLNVRARYGGDATFLAAGDYHHHVGLNTWNGRRRPASGGRGLAWFEFHLPDADAVAAVRRHLVARDVPVETDGGVPTVTDPDGVRVRFVSP